MKMPPQYIPKPEMTKAQVFAHVELCKTHFDQFDINVNINSIQVGDSLTWSFLLYNESYNTIVVEDFNWEEFEDLRVEWEKDVTIAA